MKTKFGMRVLSVLLTASMVLSASSGMASAVNTTADGLSYARNTDTSDTSVPETTESSLDVPEAVVLEGDRLDKAEAPTGLDGSGTEQNPYQITSFDDFLLMEAYINYPDSAEKHFILMNDIDLSTAVFPQLDDPNFETVSAFKNFDGIYAMVSAKPSLCGNSNVYFHLDGNGKMLSGLNAAVPDGVGAAAVFGYLNANSVIENLIVKDCALFVNNASNGAYAFLAVQNCGTISGCTVADSAMDLRASSVSTSTEEDYFTFEFGDVYKGCAFIVADNMGTVSGCTVTGADSNKGIYTRGDRRFIGFVAGQNRKDISDCTVSGVRVLAYGSADANNSFAGKGTVASYIGGIAGYNRAKTDRADKDAVITGCSVTLSYGCDILFGDCVGGIAGANDGAIRDSQTNGSFSPEDELPVYSTANMYGCGRYGGIAGMNTGTVASSGAYDIGFCFSDKNEKNAYGGIVGCNGGVVTASVATGSVNVNVSDAAAGGIVGYALKGSVAADCYTLVKVSEATAYTGAVIGKNGTTSNLGMSNFWSSTASGIAYPVPNDGAEQNDLVSRLSAVNIPVGDDGIDVNTESMNAAWSGSSAVITVQADAEISVSNAEINVAKTSTGYHFSSETSGAYGQLLYPAEVVFPNGVGISGKSIRTQISVPVRVTDSERRNGIGLAVPNSEDMLVGDAPSSGSGTAADPYVLTTASQFSTLYSQPAKYFVLGADIDLTSQTGFWSATAFTGTLDGKDPVSGIVHTISGLTVSTTGTDAGLFSSLGGTVTDIAFVNCSVESTNAAGNAGMVAGQITANGSISGVTVTNSTVTGTKHVGGIAGFSAGGRTIANCSVSTDTSSAGGTTIIRSVHAAGGILGSGGVTITGCSVEDIQVLTAATSTAGYAGGICGSTGSFVTGDGEYSTAALRKAAAVSSFVNCTVNGTVITATVSTTGASAYSGGIVGCAEAGSGSTSSTQLAYMCSTTIQSCLVDGDSTVTSTAEGNPTSVYSYAGGLLGFVGVAYKGMAIYNNETYAAVCAIGNTSTTNENTTAAGGALGAMGYTTATTKYIFQDGVPTFYIRNNVCSGTIQSSHYAGGIAGGLFGKTAAKYQLTSGEFVCGNIISAEFEAVSEWNASESSDAYFGVFVGYLLTGTCMTSATSPVSVMFNNYYSSFVTKTPTDPFGSGSTITVCGLYDVARSTQSTASNPVSSFFVKNNYLESGVLSDLDSAPFESTAIGYHYGDGFSNTYSKPARLIFDVRTKAEIQDPNSVPVPSTDLGLSGASLDVYGTGGYSGVSHVLQIQGFSLTPGIEAYYTCAASTYSDRHAAALTVVQNGCDRDDACLIADLGYGLLVGILISPDASEGPGETTEGGTKENPYEIPDIQTFVDFFCRDWTASENQRYLTYYYKQTADISFEDGIQGILENPGDYSEDIVARADDFTPIGTEDYPFIGHYDGAQHTLANFTYTSINEDNIGLFGYIADPSSSLPSDDYRVKDLHIELADEGISGGICAGGIAGTYRSKCPVVNCSVVYGTISAAKYCGGLFGRMSDSLLDGCFASTDVRVSGDGFDTAGGGLVGFADTVNTIEGEITFNRCFCSSDVVAPWFASGFLGRLTGSFLVIVTDCACTASVTAEKLLTDKKNYVPVSLMIGNIKNTQSDTFLSPNTNDRSMYVTVNNVYIAGTNATAYYAESDEDAYYPTLFGAFALGEGSSNIYYDASVIGRISVPRNRALNSDSATPFVQFVNGTLYKANVDETKSIEDRTSDTIGDEYREALSKVTSDLTSASAEGFGAAPWDRNDPGSYPVLDMYDAYSDVFARLSALPVFVDPREAGDLTAEDSRKYCGLTYPSSVSQTFRYNDSDNAELSIYSSVYSAGSDTVTYPDEYDVNLFGGSAANSDTKKTDLLFKDQGSQYLILRNSYLDSADNVPRDERNPQVTVSATVLLPVVSNVSEGTESEPEGTEPESEEEAEPTEKTIRRAIRIPLRGADNTVFVSTERQLRAIMDVRTSGQDENAAGTKFYNAYIGALLKNIMICADIDMNSDISFNPISGYGVGDLTDASKITGINGENCVIRNLYIDKPNVNNVGLFAILDWDNRNTNLAVQNIILSNVDVTGHDYTGALAGQIGANVFVNNCLVINENDETSTVTGNESVGGLIGAVANAYVGYDVENSAVVSKGQISGSAANVTGNNYVGGFAGKIENSRIANAFAKGDVTMNGYTFYNNAAAGGFAGLVKGSEESASAIADAGIHYAFASGDVCFEPSNDIAPTNDTVESAYLGIGGFAGVAEMTVEKCFSSGGVRSCTANYAGSCTLVHGIGGLVGYSAAGVQDSYSASAVNYDNSPASFSSSRPNVTVAIGGVVGYSESSVEHVYSSGSITMSILEGVKDVFAINAGSEPSAIYYGGAVGYADDVSGVYFDKWTNNLANLNAVGNMEDAENNNSSLTTSAFCGNVLPSGFDGTVWGCDYSTYPYLKDFCKADVSDYVRFPAVLSVVAVQPDANDISVRNGRGYSMPVTVPTSVNMEYILKSGSSEESGSSEIRTYNLHWDYDHVSATHEDGTTIYAPILNANTGQFLELTACIESYSVSGQTDPYHGYYEKTSSGKQIIADGQTPTGNQICLSAVTPVRDNYTPRVGDYVTWKEGYEDYGTGKIRSLYQMMLGTEDYPYLISNANDLKHIAFEVVGGAAHSVAGDSSPDMYDHWYSPVNSNNVNVSGVVHFKFITNVDMTGETFTPICSMDGNTYGSIDFMGIEIDGADFAVTGFSGTQFIAELDEESSVNNLVFSDAALTGANNVALIGTNNGTVDGLMLMDSSVEASGNQAAGIAAVNNGTIRSSIAKATIEGSDYIGGIAAENNGMIELSVSDSALTGAASTSGIGGIVGKNGTAGIVRESFSLGSAACAENNTTTYVGGFVGDNAGTIESSYTRTVVSGSYEKGGSFVGTNSGAISDAFSAGRTTIYGTDETSAGSAFAGTKADSGTLNNAWADKALLGSGTYMLVGDAEVTENLINIIPSTTYFVKLKQYYAVVDSETDGAKCIVADEVQDIDENQIHISDVQPRTTGDYSIGNYVKLTAEGTGKTVVANDTVNLNAETEIKLQDVEARAQIGFTAEIGDVVQENTVFTSVDGFANVYPQIRRIVSADGDLLKDKLLKAYSGISVVTIDSAYANYVDQLAAADNILSTVPTGFTVTPNAAQITSGTGTVIARAGQITAASGLTFTPEFNFDYAVTGAINPNFADGTGTENDPYIIQDEQSFSSLAYYGKATDVDAFKMEADVSFDGEDLPAPITKLNGSLDGNGHTVSDLTIENNTSLFGSVAPLVTISNLGLVGVNIEATPSAEKNCFGLLAAKTDGATIQDVYAVGEIKIHNNDDLSSQPVHVGGLIGNAHCSTISGVVTSGYIRNEHVGTDSTVGGVIGLMDGGTLTAAESTAYVFGDSIVGGIAGKEINGTVSDVIFAGTAADTILTTYGATGSDPATIHQIIGSPEHTVGGTYDRQLALFEDAVSSYTASSTSQIVKGTYTGFEKDTNAKYYPNPVDKTNASDAFAAGLSFALARINVSLAGGEGNIRFYDRISATSPVSNNSSDTVALTADNSSLMIQETQSSLVPDGGTTEGFTGVHAVLNNGTGATFAGNENSIYRYLEPEIVRTVGLDYVLADDPNDDTTFGNTTKVGLMLNVNDGGDGFCYNAVTSISEDSDTSSGAYTVKFQRFAVPKTAGTSAYSFTVNTLLPEGYRVSLIEVPNDDVYAGAIKEGTVNTVELGDKDMVKIIVTLTDAEPGWGLRRVDSGLN